MQWSTFYKNHWINIDQDSLDRYQRMFQWNPASSALYAPADIRVGQIVADFGCGPGYTAIEIAKCVGTAGHVHALDINSDFTSQTRKNANAAGVGNRVTAQAFCAFLGSFAGNVALTFEARGGVYIAGGIAPRILNFLVQSEFRKRFEAKGRFQNYLKAIPTYVITHPAAALIGVKSLVEARR